MKYDKSSASTRPPSQPTKPTTSSISETLTKSEVEQLLQHDREVSAYARKAFSRRQA